LDDLAAPLFIAFPLHLWSHESVWVLLYTYTACLVFYMVDVQLFLRSLGAYLSDNRNMNHQRRLKDVCIYLFIYLFISGFQPLSSCAPPILIFKIPLCHPSQNNSRLYQSLGLLG
jgi:hypothetical protein